MKVCAYNVENLFVSTHAPHPDEKSPEKCQALAAMMLDIDADLFMLSEVGGMESLLNFNQKYLQNNYQVHLIPGNSDRGIELAYLVKRNFAYQFELHSHAHRVLSFHYAHAPREKVFFSRDLAEGRIYDKQKNLQVLFFLCHFKSRRHTHEGDPNSIHRREAEVALMIDIVLERKKEFPLTPIVVGGDFNGVCRMGEDPEFEQIFKRTDLIDVLHHLPEDKRATFAYFSHDEVIPMALDYLLVSPHIKIKQAWVHRGPYSFPPATPFDLPKAPSDHCPVVAQLEFS